jgi:hypothetical protein
LNFPVSYFVLNEDIRFKWVLRRCQLHFSTFHFPALIFSAFGSCNQELYWSTYSPTLKFKTACSPCTLCIQQQPWRCCGHWCPYLLCSEDHYGVQGDAEQDAVFSHSVSG